MILNIKWYVKIIENTFLLVIIQSSSHIFQIHFCITQCKFTIYSYFLLTIFIS